MKLDELACSGSVSVGSAARSGFVLTRRRTALIVGCVLTLVAMAGTSALAINLPSGFVDEVMVSGIESPAGFEFAPDGRLFFSERINGLLRTATYDGPNDAWIVEPIPYAAFDVPVDGSGFPEAHRSSGVRDFAFDPDFATNGFVYVFYMKHNPRHNRVVRIQQNPSDPRVALSGETLLLNLPFNSTSSSGSHNGGAVEFGADGTLFVATGDGWNGGDGVQSLATYTGKLFRIMPDGSIPSDNPFFAEAVGPLRAIYALGLRKRTRRRSTRSRARCTSTRPTAPTRRRSCSPNPARTTGIRGTAGSATAPATGTTRRSPVGRTTSSLPAAPGTPEPAVHSPRSTPAACSSVIGGATAAPSGSSTRSPPRAI